MSIGSISLGTQKASGALKPQGWDKGLGDIKGSHPVGKSSAKESTPKMDGFTPAPSIRGFDAPGKFENAPVFR